jgi:hypothetical protein
MKAEKRNRFLEYYFHITLALFALGSIFIALFEKPLNADSFENVLTFTSICTLSISLIIFGFAFGETAAKHRSCYLDLQKLRLATTCDVVELNTKYIETLAYYPNHSTSDYMNVVISNIFSEKQELKNSNGDQIYFSKFSRLKYSALLFASIVLATTLTATPVLLALASISII